MKSEANKLLVATVKKLLHHKGHPQLMKLISNTHPADLAYVFNRLTKQDRLEFFPLVSNIETAAELITEVEPLVCRDFLQALSERQIVNLIEYMSGDDVADILDVIDDEERKELILTMMHREELATTQSLMEYDPESAGGLMVPDFLALAEDMTAKQALEHLQEDAGNAEVILYLYVVDAYHHLVGVMSLRELVVSPPDRIIRDFMIQQVIRVSVSADQEDVARLIARYNLIALPVVDANNKLLGVVTVDDIIDVIRSEATEDMMLMAGAGDRQVEELHPGVFDSVKSRSPWLLPGAVTGILSLVMLYISSESSLKHLGWILLLPGVLILASIIASQSGAIVTRGLVLERTNFARSFAVIRHEFTIGMVLSFAWSLVASLSMYLLVLFDSSALQSTMPTGVFVLLCGMTTWLTLTLSTALGAALPIAAHKLGRDPAAGSGLLGSAMVYSMVIILWCVIAMIVF